LATLQTIGTKLGKMQILQRCQNFIEKCEKQSNRQRCTNFDQK